MTRLFTSSDFIPRSSCGAWTPAYQWLYIVSHGTIAMAYLAIPTIFAIVCVWNKYARREIIIRRNAMVWTGMFVLACGIGHVIDGIGSFWWPMYRFFAVWHALTAVISMFAIAAYASTLEWRRGIADA